MRIGTLASLGFPGGLGLDVFARVVERWDLGVGVGYVPDLPVPAAGGASLTRVSAQAVARFFPWRGPFFVGTAGGYQQTRGSLTSSVATTGQATTVDVHGFGHAVFVTPHVGLLFTSGRFTIGADAGVDIPILAQSPSFQASHDGLTLPVTGTGSAAAAMRLATTRVIPDVHLLRMGWIF